MILLSHFHRYVRMCRSQKKIVSSMMGYMILVKYLHMLRLEKYHIYSPENDDGIVILNEKIFTINKSVCPEAEIFLAGDLLKV